ncbi:MAG: hypothetical protein A2231_11690 [Candidatus Firestonebacteria bacterium RIFOXYA2_FULL_40_8]|nr:MAG: hypothetical protein A2231_11690 [Candidatus Firestonebacteria bacterium RIFOXYA2_FULL_40_8]
MSTDVDKARKIKKNILRVCFTGLISFSVFNKYYQDFRPLWTFKDFYGPYGRLISWYQFHTKV